MEFELLALGYELISMKDAMQCFKLTDSLLITPHTDEEAGDNLTGFKLAQADLVCIGHKGGGGGAAGGYRIGRTHGYKAGLKPSNRTMWHELGHATDWGGDFQGRGVEGGLLGSAQVFEGSTTQSHQFGSGQRF